MPTLKKLFHQLGNWHQKILLNIGVSKDISEGAKLEEYILAANETAKELKKQISDIEDNIRNDLNAINVIIGATILDDEPMSKDNANKIIQHSNSISEIFDKLWE